MFKLYTSIQHFQVIISEFEVVCLSVLNLSDTYPPYFLITSSCFNSTLLLTQLSSNFSKSVFRTNPFVNVQLLLNICSLTFYPPKLSAPQPLGCSTFNLCFCFLFVMVCFSFFCFLVLWLYLSKLLKLFLTLRIFTSKKEKLIYNLGCCHRGIRKWNSCFIYPLRTHLLSISCMHSTGLNAGYKDEINMVTDIGKLYNDLKRHLDS